MPPQLTDKEQQLRRTMLQLLETRTPTPRTTRVEETVARIDSSRCGNSKEDKPSAKMVEQLARTLSPWYRR